MDDSTASSVTPSEREVGRGCGARPRRRRTVMRLALLGLSTLLALPLAELTYRVASKLRGKPYDAHAAEDFLRASATAMNESMPRTDPRTGEQPYDGKAMHPFIGVDSRHGLAMGELYARQFLSGELDDAFTVVVLGGSVAAQSAADYGPVMTATLERDPRLAGRRIVVISQGRGGLKAPQQATLFTYLLSMGWDPDAVINIDGLNEVALGSGNVAAGVHPLHPDYATWCVLAARRNDLSQEIRLAGRIVTLAEEGRDIANEAIENGWTKSAILGDLAARRVAARKRRWGELQGEYAALLAGGTQRNPAKGPIFEEQGAAAIERMIIGWEQNSISLAALCAARGIRYVHVLQPTLHDVGSKTLTPEELEKGGANDVWKAGVRDGYPKLRERGAKLAERGIAFVDLSYVFKDFTDTAYYDLCHFRGRAAELFSERCMQEVMKVFPAEIGKRERRH